MPRMTGPGPVSRVWEEIGDAIPLSVGKFIAGHEEASCSETSQLRRWVHQIIRKTLLSDRPQAIVAACQQLRTDRVYRDITRDRTQPPSVGRQKLHIVMPASQGRPSLMQADVFGAADLALPVEAGTQNPELGAADLWSPQQFQELPGRKRQRPLRPAARSSVPAPPSRDRRSSSFPSWSPGFAMLCGSRFACRTEGLVRLCRTTVRELC